MLEATLLIFLESVPMAPETSLLLIGGIAGAW
jgi:hypothetical protein